MSVINIVIICVFISSGVQCRDFSNPILEGDNIDNYRVRKFNSEYIAIAYSKLITTGNGLLPLFSSSDLQYWNLTSFASIDSDPGNNGFAVDIHMIDDDNFVLYQTYTVGLFHSIATYHSSSLYGPYSDRVGDLDINFANSSFIYKFINQRTLFYDWHSNEIQFVFLSPDGQSRTSESTTILEGDLQWERYSVNSPVIVQLGNYWYMFYTGGRLEDDYCHSQIGVARGNKYNGPFTKRPDPLDLSDGCTVGLHTPNIIDDVLIYSAYEANACNGTDVGKVLLLAQTMTIGLDLWPKFNISKPSCE